MTEELVLDRFKMKKIMLNKGLNKYELADKMNVAPSTVYRILNGDRKVSVAMAGKIIKSLDLEKSSLDELFIFVNPLPKGNGKEIT